MHKNNTVAFSHIKKTTEEKREISKGWEKYP